MAKKSKKKKKTNLKRPPAKRSTTRKKKIRAKASSPKSGAILLENGSVYKGFCLGAQATTGAEFVFHTSPTGYQEILTDPSYRRQAIVFAAPQIGNQGFHVEDSESSQIWAAACVMRDYSPTRTHWRQQKSLEDFLKEQAIPALTGVDTRRLVLELRDRGAMRGVISTETQDLSVLRKILAETPSMENLSLTGEVSSQLSAWTEASHDLLKWGRPEIQDSELRRVVVIDFGVKRQILRYLVDVGFSEVMVLPSTFRVEDVEACNPDAVLLSNGPGDPSSEKQAIVQVQKMLGRWPILGICLGHQILGLALGMSTYKLKFGHHAANHPVWNENEKKAEISSQNHGFAVKRSEDLDSKEKVLYWHMNDKSLAGFISEDQRCCGVQFHPEASPGPLDSVKIFENFRLGRFCFS